MMISARFVYRIYPGEIQEKVLTFILWELTPEGAVA